MQTTQLTKLKLHSRISLAILIVGVLLLSYMIPVESEPGALPLLLVLTGTVWYAITRWRMRAANR